MGRCPRFFGPPYLWGGVRRSRTEGPEQFTSSPFMGRCPAKPDGGARAAHLLPIYGEVSGEAGRRGQSRSPPPHLWGGVRRSGTEGPEQLSRRISPKQLDLRARLLQVAQ